MDPIIRTIDKQKCSICESKGEMLHEGLKDKLFGAPGEWSLRRCSNRSCGLVWLDPCPIEKDIIKAYQVYYTHAATEDKSTIKSRLAVLLRNFFAKVVTCLFEQRRERVHMYLYDMAPGRILDIGCGEAKFLNRMKQAGWSVQGVDFDAAAATNAKALFDIDVHIGTLEDLQFPESSFDAVTMNHVIEHVFDPVALLIEVRRILKPGGRLVMVTPNAMGMGHRFFGRFWRGLEPPRHIQIFTSNSLEAVVHLAGLEIRRTFTTAVNAWIIFAASFVIERRNETNECGNVKPTKVEHFQGLKMQLSESRRIKKGHHEGEELVLIATKTEVNLL